MARTSPIGAHRIRLAVMLLLVSVLMGCGQGSGSDGGQTADPAAYAGSWTFEDKPTAFNPVRVANVTINSGGGSKLEVQGNMGTALYEFTIAGSGDVAGDGIQLDLSCTAESGTWTSATKFSLTPEGKLHTTIHDKNGDEMSFELVKSR